MAAALVQCFSCPKKFYIETTKGQPMMPTCNDCSRKMKRYIQDKSSKAQVTSGGKK